VTSRYYEQKQRTVMAARLSRDCVANQSLQAVATRSLYTAVALACKQQKTTR